MRGLGGLSRGKEGRGGLLCAFTTICAVTLKSECWFKVTSCLVNIWLSTFCLTDQSFGLLTTTTYSECPFKKTLCLVNFCPKGLLPHKPTLLFTWWFINRTICLGHNFFRKCRLIAKFLTAAYKLWVSRELVRWASNTHIFIDLHLPHLTHLHDALHLSCMLSVRVNVWTCPLWAGSRKLAISLKSFDYPCFF